MRVSIPRLQIHNAVVRLMPMVIIALSVIPRSPSAKTEYAAPKATRFSKKENHLKSIPYLGEILSVLAPLAWAIAILF